MIYRSKRALEDFYKDKAITFKVLLYAQSQKELTKPQKLMQSSLNV